ncbi:hypothetical protein TNCV_1599631 [Trichonephila clavipes]|nr:hypothetical protein TNCV_1599631 [Trichonephila clavipes]
MILLSEVVESLKDKNKVTLNMKITCVFSSPNEKVVTYFRLLVNHGCLKSHLFRIDTTDSLDCALCDSGLTTYERTLQWMVLIQHFENIIDLLY